MDKGLEPVNWRGVRLGRRTVDLLEHAEILSGIKIRAIQGGWSTSVAASANTHAGDGVFDVYPLNGNHNELVRWHRLCGLWTWHRPELWRNGTKVWGEHWHGIDLGNPNISDAARKQVQDAYHGLDGLATHYPDRDFRPNVIIKGIWPIPNVNLKRMKVEAKKTKNWTPRPGVRRIQRALNLKSGTHLLVDGIFGPKTRAAYARFEKQNGGDGDGIPAMYALRLLAAGRFNIHEK